MKSARPMRILIESFMGRRSSGRAPRNQSSAAFELRRWRARLDPTFVLEGSRRKLQSPEEITKPDIKMSKSSLSQRFAHEVGENTSGFIREIRDRGEVRPAITSKECGEVHPALAASVDDDREGSILEEEEQKMELDMHELMMHSADEFDKLIKHSEDPRSNEDLFSEARQSDFLSTYSSKEGWTLSVNAMKACRILKERLITLLAIAKKAARSRDEDEAQAGREMVTKTESELDSADRLENLACSHLYGAFRYLSRMDTVPRAQLFNKKECDIEIERKFGSLNNPGQGPIAIEEARRLFSNYLSRKIWVPTPWRKLLVATNDFIDRVVNNPIQREVNTMAQRIASRILYLLCLDGDSKPFRDREYTPESSCVEASINEGGKRFYLLTKSKPNFKKRKVKPASILTGGKIRTITTDSAYNCKYIWINKYLGSRFRQLRCSVFGGDVEEWFKKIGGLTCRQGEKFLSGDLESATDNFDGRITRQLIEEFCDYEGLSRQDFEQLCSFTTDAILSVGSQKFKQTRGQLMGSVISFPFLCILSLTAFLYTRKDEKWMKHFLGDDDKKSWKMLRHLKGVGINGDDVVFPATEEVKEKWIEGVEAIGGVVSRGKTLFNDTYFTINSELWTCKGKVNCLRPSLLTALTGDNRYFINPAYEWKEFRGQSLHTPEAEEIWDLVSKLNLDLPRSFGGVGLVNRFDPERMFEALVRKKNTQANRLPMVGSQSFVDRKKDLKERMEFAGPMIECLAPREFVKTYSSVYGNLDGGWNLNPRECRMVTTILLRPDLFPEESSRLEPFRTQILAYKFVSIQETRNKLSVNKEFWISELRRNYNRYMNGYKDFRLPTTLLKPYYAIAHPRSFDAPRPGFKVSGPRVMSGMGYSYVARKMFPLTKEFGLAEIQKEGEISFPSSWDDREYSFGPTLSEVLPTYRIGRAGIGSDGVRKGVTSFVSGGSVQI